MNKQIEKDLSELTAAGILPEETASQIRDYYALKRSDSSGRLILVFGILGALLVGLGLILIIAHNWDELPRLWKIFFAMLPLLAGQVLCAYTLTTRMLKVAWRETSSVLLFFGIAASISIVSQVYNIPGHLSDFLFLWMLLSLPLIYLMRSAATSLLYIIGITVYACDVSYFSYPSDTAWYYWAMLGALLPFAIRVTKQGGNFAVFHQWFICLSVIITLGMFESQNDLIIVAYMTLFSILVMIGDRQDGRIINNAFLATGSLGGVIVLLLCTFEFIWGEIGGRSLTLDEDLAVTLVLIVAAFILLYRSVKGKGASAIHPASWLFLLFGIAFSVGYFNGVLLAWFANAMLLGLAVVTTLRGADRGNVFVLNYGLLILATLILCRILDTNLTFVIRGILFLVVGISFFAANYWVLRKRKTQNV